MVKKGQTIRTNFSPIVYPIQLISYSDMFWKKFEEDK